MDIKPNPPSIIYGYSTWLDGWEEAKAENQVADGDLEPNFYIGVLPQMEAANGN